MDAKAFDGDPCWFDNSRDAQIGFPCLLYIFPVISRRKEMKLNVFKSAGNRYEFAAH